MWGEAARKAVDVFNTTVKKPVDIGVNLSICIIYLVNKYTIVNVG